MLQLENQGLWARKVCLSLSYHMHYLCLRPKIEYKRSILLVDSNKPISPFSHLLRLIVRVSSSYMSRRKRSHHIYSPEREKNWFIGKFLTFLKLIIPSTHVNSWMLTSSTAQNPMGLSEGKTMKFLT